MSEKTKTPANTLEVKLTASETNGVLQFEGTATIPHFTKTKLSSKDGITKFESLSTLKGLARRAATKYGYEGVTYDEAAVQRKVAAKKTSAPKKATTPATAGPATTPSN